jgi:hypothetical protein
MSKRQSRADTNASRAEVGLDRDIGRIFFSGVSFFIDRSRHFAEP